MVAAGFLHELADRITWWNQADRLGPDILSTHLLLYLPKAGKRLCKKKFKHFAEGAEFRPGAYAVQCSNISIGRNVVIRPETMIFASADADVTIEENVLMGSGVHIYTANHEFANPDLDIIEQGHRAGKPVTLCKGCWIGANTIILPGVTVGDNAVVGAGSVVTKDIPARKVAVGNPAKVIRHLE